jgi:hypothetical protein
VEVKIRFSHVETCGTLKIVESLELSHILGGKISSNLAGSEEE